MYKIYFDYMLQYSLVFYARRYPKVLAFCTKE